MSIDINFHSQARDAMAVGVGKLADAVKVTLGPRGRYVALERGKNGTRAPLVTNDGVTVARDVFLENPVENMGAQLIKEAAIKTNSIAGDGTTTATILANEIVREGLKNITAGENPIAIRRGIVTGAKAVVKEITENATKLESNEQIASVGAISARDDETGDGVGERIAEAMEKVGSVGVITIEESQTFGIDIEIVEGMQYERGYISPYMVTDRERMEAVLEDPYILITDQKVTTIQEILPILEEVTKVNKPLFIVAEDVEGDALATMLLNKVRGAFQFAAVKAPGFGERRKRILEDIAVVTGGTFYAKDLGLSVENATIDKLGKAKSVKVTKDTTIIVGGSGDSAAIEKRCEEIRAEIPRTSSDYERKKMHERLGKLTGGVAIMRVGAATESEMKEKRSRIEDALQATLAATEEGIVPGGGVALLDAIPVLDSVECRNKGEQVGVDILRRALEAPVRAIAENAGFEPGMVVEKIKAMPKGEGINFATEETGNMIDMQVIDPVKVTRTALQSAVSVACLIIVTEASINEIPKEGQDMTELVQAMNARNGGGMNMGGMMM